MSIDIIKQPSLDLKMPEFLCDYVLSNKLEEIPMLSHMNKFNTTCILGKAGSGKTSFMISLLTNKGKNKIYRKLFDHIILVMPSNSRASLKNNPFKNHPTEKMYDELSYENMKSIYDTIEANASNKETTLLILDDVGGQLKNKQIQYYLKILNYNRRHLKCCQLYLLQNYMSIPLDIRKVFTNYVIFKISKREIENICNEVMEQPKELAIDILNLFEKPYQFIFINTTTGKMYLGFDEIVVKTT